jgi:hypothetical protein
LGKRGAVGEAAVSCCVSHYRKRYPQQKCFVFDELMTVCSSGLVKTSQQSLEQTRHQPAVLFSTNQHQQLATNQTNIMRCGNSPSINSKIKYSNKEMKIFVISFLTIIFSIG